MNFSPQVMELAEQVVVRNRAAGRCIATAESCTGGLVAGAITEIAGSSDIFDRGFITYSNEAKVKALGVGLDIIETFGAVSEATAWAMARGALERSNADVAVAITGIAGPGGGSEDKPVGTVCFCVRHRDGRSATRTTRLPGDRNDVRERSTTVAMHLLRRVLSPPAGRSG